ncbi:MAG: EamA family transporter RarD [Tissierellia bacterium]|nr:EamA family transporter RarD [Tissierellia bacterium]
MNKGALWVLLSYVIWGLLTMFWKLMAGVDALFVLSNRIIWSMVFCGIILLFQGRGAEIKEQFKDKNELKMILLAGITITINWGLYIGAVMGGHILDASLAYFMYPLFSVVAGFLVFKERPHLLQWAAVGLATIGVAISAVAYGKIPVFALTIAVSFVSYGAIKKHIKVTGVMSVFMETLVVLPLALIYVFMKWGAVTIQPMQLWLLPVTGIVTSMPLIFYSKGMQVTPMTISGLLMYINPTIQFSIGYLVYHEAFSRSQAWTFGFVWLGVGIFLINTLANLKKNQHSKLGS